MFTKNDSFYLASPDTNGVLQAMGQALVQRGMAQPQAHGSGLATIGSPIGNGVTPQVQVMLFPAQGGMQVNVQLKAQIDSGNMTMFVICLFLFWPLALYFGWMAHQTFERAANDLMGAMRYALTPYFQQGAPAQGAPAQGSLPQGSPPSGSPF